MSTHVVYAVTTVNRRYEPDVRLYTDKQEALAAEADVRLSPDDVQSVKVDQFEITVNLEWGAASWTVITP